MAEMENKKLGVLEVVKSTLMSFFGVQKGSVRQRDFEHGKPLHFIIAGLVLTFLFVFTLFVLVKLILHIAGI